MAEGEESPNFPNSWRSIDNESDTEEPVKLDLIDLNKERITNTSPEHNFQSAGTMHNEAPTRREENPFSFKHFLRSDNTYHHQGARPKVYCEGRPIASISELDLHPSSETKQTRIVPEFSSALPDFVQDHLVIEQCYLGNSSQNNYNVDVNNLPDFAPSRNNSNINRLNSDGSRILDARRDSNTINIPLDLPVRPQAEFPLDLPGELQSGSRSCPPSSEVGNSKSLPDFLADGAVRNQQNDLISGQSPDREVDRLRQDLDVCRRLLVEQNRRADYLSRELEIARNKEHEYTQNLAKALEQVEENLERSNIRAASSENTILKLRQEVKSLNTENNMLRRENRTLRSEDGASGGSSLSTPTEIQSHRIAHDIRTAANSAEHTLRQLLTGVENLHMLASSVESMYRIEERTDTYHSKRSDDTGPAL